VQVVLRRHAVEQIPGLRTVRDTIPDKVERAVTIAMAKLPADRFGTATQFAEAIAMAEAVYRTGSRPSVRARAKVQKVALRGSAAAAIIGMAVAMFVLLRGSGAPGLAAPDPGVVAVLPFRVTGTVDPSLGNLREGILELLYVHLPGEGGPRAVYPGTVTAAWRLAGGSDSSDLSEVASIQVAEELGAGRLLLGHIFGGGNVLALSASLRAVPGGAELARVEEITGPSDSVLFLVDRLTAELLARGAGESEERLSDLVTAELPALRSYLAGQAAYTRGDYRSAVDHLSHAVEEDSTFALAALGLASADAMLGSGVQREAIRLAWAGRERLTSRDRTYLTAFAGLRYPAPSTLAERIAAWDHAVSAMPDRRDTWYQWGDDLFHWGPMLGATNAHERAIGAFWRALELDREFAPALGHLLELSARYGDTATVRSVGARYLTTDSIGALADFYRWRTAVALNATSSLRQIRARFDDLARSTLDRILTRAQLDGTAIQDAVRAGEILKTRSSVGGDLRAAYFKSRLLALNRGRPGDARQMRGLLRGLPVTEPSDGLVDVLEALYWDGDSATAATFVQRRSSPVDAAGPEPDAFSPLYFDICAVSLWRLAHGDVETVPQAVARLRRVERSANNTQTRYIGVCAAMLEAELAATRTGADAEAALSRLDSLARVGPSRPTSWITAAAHLTLARLYEARGELGEALAAVRRRPYEEDGVVALSAFLREEGRLAALAGDREGAIRAYDHYLALRSDHEPAASAEVAQVRSALAQLVGEQGGR
jgi:tetratricopeptide (TPR) repeat protein